MTAERSEAPRCLCYGVGVCNVDHIPLSAAREKYDREYDEAMEQTDKLSEGFEKVIHQRLQEIDNEPTFYCWDCHVRFYQVSAGMHEDHRTTEEPDSGRVLRNAPRAARRAKGER